MYVILTQDVSGVGLKNNLLNVSKGYFNNYLQPRKLAQMATPSKIESLKDVIAAQKAAASQAAQEMAESAKALSDVVLVLSGKTSAKGTLFKALSEKDIVAALKKQAGVEVSKDAVEMEPMKKVGDYSVQVRLGTQKVTIKVKLEAKEEK